MPWNRGQACYGISGSFRVEQGTALPWNQWQDSPGIGGSFGVEYADREVRIAAADLNFTSKSSDQVVIGGKTYQVMSVNTCEPFSEAAIHIVQVRGGNG